MRDSLRKIIDEELLTSEELGEKLGIDGGTIRQRQRRGQLEGVKKGVVWLFDREDGEPRKRKRTASK